MPSSPPGELPVTVVISRRPVPGHEAELLTWAHGVRDAAAEFAGHLGGQIYPPNPPECDDVVIAFSFASADQLAAWERSPQRQEWLRRADPIVTRAHAHGVSGFEGIFAHTPGAPVIPPPRWKTALIIALALYPMSLLLAWVLGPLTSTWFVPLRVLLTTAIVVPYMAWVGVPWLTGRLRGWLQRS